jgi:hypothetical protein
MIVPGVVDGSPSVPRAEMVGPYRLIDRLGAGGMGEVWRVLDTRKGREVAVKMMGSWLGAEPGLAARFRREAALAARLNAPNIVPIHDYGEINGRLFMEMPLIRGKSLTALVGEQGALEPARAVAVIEQIAEALDTAHAAGMVHRDVKPSNVLIATRRGCGDFVYLIDFGIACTTDGTRMTGTGREVGTAAYMAPERFSGVSGASSDVYALACVLFQALTGRDPFVPPQEVCELPFYLNAHLHRPPPAPSAHRSSIPSAFDAVIAQGMAKDPGARYPTAGALSAAARAALGAAPAPTLDRDRQPPVLRQPCGAPPIRVAGSGGAATVVAPPVLPRGEHRLVGHTGAVFAVALTEMAGVPVVVSGGRDATVRVWDLATGASVRPALTGHAGPVRALATTTVDGRAVVISGSDDRTVRVWDLASGALIGPPFTGHSYGVCAVATTQLDHRPLVISSSLNDTARAWDLTTGFAHPLPADRVGYGVLALATAQLQTRLVAVGGGADKTLRMWDVATGTPVEPRLHGHTRAVRAVAVCDVHGRAVAVSAGDDHTVRAWDLASGIPVGDPLTGHTGLVHAVATGRHHGRPVAVSASHDTTIRIVDLARGVPVGLPLTGHRGFVHGVAAAQVGGRLVVASASHDKTVRIWDLTARIDA